MLCKILDARRDVVCALFVNRVAPAAPAALAALAAPAVQVARAVDQAHFASTMMTGHKLNKLLSKRPTIKNWSLKTIKLQNQTTRRVEFLDFLVES